MTGPIVRVEDLRVEVPGSHTIVDGVTFDLRPGEVLGLVGESGSGKSTVSLALLGHARQGTALRGRVEVDGVDMIAASASERQRIRGQVISYVPQDPSASLNPTMRIGPQLRDRLPSHGDRSAATSRIAEVLDSVHLPSSREFLRRYPHQLSGGQVQRVCIALAVLRRPRVIVLDEPTTGLDVMTQARVLELLRELIRAHGTAAVYVTHDLAVVAGLADRLAVMYSGLFLEGGATDTLVQRPLHPYTRRLILSTPSVHTRKPLVGIGGVPLNPRDRRDECPFAPRCEFAIPRCTAGLPALEPIGIDRQVRCTRSVEFMAESVTERVTGVADLWNRLPSARKTPLLEARNFCASYGHHEVLHGVEFALSEGECLALVGESGSGKTTLARCISGLHAGSSSGTICFDGEEIPHEPRRRQAEIRRSIQYVFQSPYTSLNPRHRVGQSIALPLQLFGLTGSQSREAVRELLTRVSLDPDYETRFPSQLSGGERQRVAIARALAARPRVLICDEVTSSLDVSIQASILELLGRLRSEMNLTILFITHHLALVRAVADRALIMRDGVVVEEGYAEDLLDDPHNAYTRDLLSSTPVLSGVSAGTN